MQQTDLELFEAPYFENLHKAETKRNAELRANFSSCFKLPEWPCVFVYFNEQPPRTERMTSWSDIKLAFGMNDQQLAVMKALHDLGDRYGHITAAAVTTVIQSKNYKRTVDRLIKAELIQEVAQNIFTINPSIIYGRDWWSPFAQGYLVTSWMNAMPVSMPKLTNVLQLHKRDMKLGCDLAARNLKSWDDIQERKVAMAA